MNVIILGGFLGSGKTSIILQLARHLIGDASIDTTKIVILENEIGEVSVDDQILGSHGYAVENLFSGCVCCTMSGELILGLHQIIRDFSPELIIMEASGVAFPENIRKTIKQALPKLSCRVACVTDAKRWQRLLLPMEMLLKDQLDAADVILINKIDTVDAETLETVEASIRTFNNTAQFFNLSASQTIDPGVFEAMLTNKEEIAHAI